MGEGLRQRRFWTTEEDRILRREATIQLEQGSLNDWTSIAARLPLRTNKDCRKRWSKVCNNVNRGAWDAAEDERLLSAVEKFNCSWTQVATMVQTRHADQCAKRWQHSLDPNLDRSKWQPKHEAQLQLAVAAHGRNWKAIAEKEFPGRSTTDLKNRYDILERKRLAMESGCSSTRANSSPASLLITSERTSTFNNEQDNFDRNSCQSDQGQERDDDDDSVLGEISQDCERLRSNDNPVHISDHSHNINQTRNQNRPGNNYSSDLQITCNRTINCPGKNHNGNNESQSEPPYAVMNNNSGSNPSDGGEMDLDLDMFPDRTDTSLAISNQNLLYSPTSYYFDLGLNDDPQSYGDAFFLSNGLDSTGLGQNLMFSLGDFSSSVGSPMEVGSNRTADPSGVFRGDRIAHVGEAKLDALHSHGGEDPLCTDVVVGMGRNDHREEGRVNTEEAGLTRNVASNALERSPILLEAEREEAVPRSRTTLVLDDVQPDTLRCVLDTLYKDKTKLSMETWHSH